MINLTGTSTDGIDILDSCLWPSNWEPRRRSSTSATGPFTNLLIPLDSYKLPLIHGQIGVNLAIM